jgi:hypothetical protein
MVNIYHLIDPKRGRADVRKTWTLCGRAVRSCFVFRLDSKHPTCLRCKAVSGTVNRDSPDSKSSGEEQN